MSGYVLVLADRHDLGADHLVVALAELDADVVRVDPADFLQRVRLEAHLDPAVPGGWRIAMRVQGDTLDCGGRADLLTGIYRAGPARTGCPPSSPRRSDGGRTSRPTPASAGCSPPANRPGSTTPDTSTRRCCCRSSSPQPRRVASRCHRP